MTLSGYYRNYRHSKAFFHGNDITCYMIDFLLEFSFLELLQKYLKTLQMYNLN